MSTSELVLRNARFGGPDGGSMVDIRCVGGRIASVLPAGTELGGVDLAGALVLPGLVEPHAHLDKALTADAVPNPAGDLMGAIHGWLDHAREMTVADVSARAEAAARMSVANGVTLIRTHVDIGDHTDLRAVEALVEVRARLAAEVAIEITALLASPGLGPDSGRQPARAAAALQAGADHLGGCPHLEDDGAGFIDRALELAGTSGVGLDLHVDETLDPAVLFLEALAERVVATGFEGPVVAGHCVSLGAQPEITQRRVAEAVAEAGIGVVALPQTNLFLQARGVTTRAPRGLTALQALNAAGVEVAAGGDNLQDPFNLMGRGDPLEAASLMVTVGHLDVGDALASVTRHARAVLGAEPVEVTPGDPADLCVMAADSPREALAMAPSSRLTVHRGQVVHDSLT